MADTKNDPVNSSFFMVDFGDNRKGYFTSVSGGGSEFETIQHKEVGEKGKITYRAVPGTQKFTPVELQRGITDSYELWEWFEKIQNGKVGEARYDGSLVAFDASGEKEVARWNITQGWPSKLTFPKLDAKANELAMESMTIQHTGFIRVKPGG